LLHASTILSTTARGNCAGWEVLSLELRPRLEVTLGIRQTSVGFLPRGLHLSLPFFLWFGYFTSGSRTASRLKVYRDSSLTHHRNFSLRGEKRRWQATPAP